MTRLEQLARSSANVHRLYEEFTAATRERRHLAYECATVEPRIARPELMVALGVSESTLQSMLDKAKKEQ